MIKYSQIEKFKGGVRMKKTLKELRKEIRYTQREVADACEIPFSTYVAYELGYRIPKILNAEALATFYGVEIKDIEFKPNKVKQEV